MINLLAVAFEPPPWLKASAAQQALSVFDQERWSPPGATLRMIVAPCQWWGAVEAISLAASGMDTILLLGAQHMETHISVVTSARNRADPKAPDIAGDCWPGGALAPGGAPTLEGVIKAAVLSEAFRCGGVSASPGAPDDYVYNRVLYSLLKRKPLLPIALARLPLSIESARAEQKLAVFNRFQIIESVRAALSRMAREVMDPPDELALAG